MREMAERPHARARFVETKYLRLLSRPLTLRGTLSYTPPDRLEKHTLTPNEEILVADGDRVSVDIPVRGIKRSFNLQDNRVLWGFLESLRATLRGDLPALQRFYRLDIVGDEAKWRLSLTPHDADMAAVIKTIRMSGGKGVLTSIEIVETRGDRSTMTLQEDTP
jgi:outer membrane lipoprotein carrier protein LolA